MFVRNICKLQGSKKHWHVPNLLGINKGYTSRVKSGRNVDFSVSAIKIFGKIQSFCVPEGYLFRAKSFFYSLIFNVNPNMASRVVLI